MYFSCDDKSLILRHFSVINKIIEDEGFYINTKKLHFHTPSNRKRITGITVVQQTVQEEYELKAPQDLKRKIRAEIFKCIMTGDYSCHAHILGEISYICYIEEGNSHNYLVGIKKYVDKVADKILHFPELVRAYNENIFFKDSPLKAVTEINPSTADELDILEGIYVQRKAYLSKINTNDICNYTNWPSIIISGMHNLRCDTNLPL